MTDAILQSDIDLAQTLVRENCPASEVVAALARRGIDPARAAQVVEDLQCGKRVKPQLAVPPEFADRAHSAGLAPASSAKQRLKPRTGREGLPEQKLLRFDFRDQQPGEGRWLFIGLLALIVACGGLMIADHAYHAATRAELEDLESATVAIRGAITAGRGRTPLFGISQSDPRTAGMPWTDFERYRFLTNQIGRRRLNTAEAGRLNAAVSEIRDLTQNAPTFLGITTVPAAPPGLELEVEPDGLRLGDSRLTRESVLGALCRTLGAPTRTNRVAQPGRVVYSFDRHGLLAYLHQGRSRHRLVLDYDALGGTNGTLSAFAGTLKIDEQIIRADLDAQTLASNRTLMLTNVGPGGRVLAGRAHGLGICFTYLKSLQRLSRIEIDLE